MIIARDRMFKAIPDLIMSLILICPLPKTIALGGVATGSIKAQLAHMVTGISTVATS